MVCRIACCVSLVFSVALSGCSKGPESGGASQELAAGEAIVKANCRVCHAQGINGAPIIGNAKMWQPRIEKGVDALAANAIAGVGLMPAKGGHTALTDAEIKQAVAYMVSQVK